MALFKKNPIAKKSSGSGLFKPAQKATTKVHKRHGEAVPAAGFPTSEDLRDGLGSDVVSEAPDGDTRFIEHGARAALISTNVSWAEYDKHRQILRVGFHDGAVYPYAVSPAVALGLLHASSPGGYVRSHLRGHEAD
jgi:KTSC domain